MTYVTDLGEEGVRGSIERRRRLRLRTRLSIGAYETKRKYAMASPRFHLFIAHRANNFSLIEASDFLRGHFIESAAVRATKQFSRACSHRTTSSSHSQR